MADDIPIGNGRTVKMHYTLKVEGEVLDSSEGIEPLVYIHGEGEILPALEDLLAGMKAGEEKSVTLSQEQGYGPVDPEAFVEISVEKLPEGSAVPGTVLTVTGSDGQGLRAVVHEIREGGAVLDFNHPLAGKELSFEVQIIEVAF